MISIMGLIKEIKTFGFEVFLEEPICRDFEDNSGDIETASFPKIRPCNKHINIVIHHFR